MSFLNDLYVSLSLGTEFQFFFSVVVGTRSGTVLGRVYNLNICL